MGTTHLIGRTTKLQHYIRDDVCSAFDVYSSQRVVKCVAIEFLFFVQVKSQRRSARVQLITSPGSVRFLFRFSLTFTTIAIRDMIIFCLHNHIFFLSTFVENFTQHYQQFNFFHSPLSYFTLHDSRPKKKHSSLKNPKKTLKFGKYSSAPKFSRSIIGKIQNSTENPS